MTVHFRIFLRLLGLAWAGSLAAQTVALYATPDDSAPPLATVDLSSRSLGETSPVLEAGKRESGWLWTEYRGSFVGYVESRSIDASGQPRVGSLVFAAPDASSAVVSSIEEGDLGPDVSVTPATGNFQAIRLNKAIAVYLNRGRAYVVRQEVEARPSPPATAAPAPARSAPAPGDATRQQVREVTPTTTQSPAPARYIRPIETTTPSAPPPPAAPSVVAAAPAPVRAPAPAATPAPTPAPRTAPAPSTTPPPVTAAPPPTRTARAAASAPAPAATAPRPVLKLAEPIDRSINVSGQLRLAPNRALFFPPPHRYELRDISGVRIAWLELEGALFAVPLSQMLDQPVTVYGEWETKEGKQQMVLRVRSIRPDF